MVSSFSLDNVTTFIVCTFPWRMKIGVSGLGGPHKQNPCHRLKNSWPTTIVLLTLSPLTVTFVFQGGISRENESRGRIHGRTKLKPSINSSYRYLPGNIVENLQVIDVMKGIQKQIDTSFFLFLCFFSFVVQDVNRLFVHIVLALSIEFHKKKTQPNTSVPIRQLSQSQTAIKPKSKVTKAKKKYLIAFDT